MSMVGFPLLLIPLAIYNIIVFLMPGVGFTDPLLRVPLVSGEFWAVSLGDMLVAVGVLLLWLEVVKAARPGGKYLTDHLLSLLVFGAAAAEFVMWPKFANSTFFMLALLAMVDFFSGISLRAKRRARAVVAAPVVEPDEPEPVIEHSPEPVAPAPEAVIEPEPVHVTPLPELVEEPAPLPAATSVAESVLLEHPAPKPALPVTAAVEPELVEPEPVKHEPVKHEPIEPEPKVEAPELQPDATTPHSPKP